MTDSRSRARIPWPFRGSDEVERRSRARTYSLERRVAELGREIDDLGRILDGIGEGVLAVDRAGIVVHANTAAVEMLGLQPGSTIGSHMYVAVPIDGICHALDGTMRAGDLAGRAQREVVIASDAGERTLLVSTTPLRSGGRDEAAAEGAIAVVRDVTEIRRLEGSRRDFFANVSHELKTPITAIRGALETILDDSEMSPADRRRFLASAARHASRLGSLVADLMSLARLEAGDDVLLFRPVDMRGLAAEVVAAAEQSARRSGVAVRIDGGSEATQGSELVALVDEEAMRQALTNLVDNAVAHSMPGGEVRILLGVRSGICTIEVEDDGTGIPAEALGRIFERFFRVDAARSRERGGTGIGLSIVKHVAQAHRGNVSVTSDLGTGSRFTLVFPVSRRSGIGT